MKVTYSWIKDFVDLRISAKSLADKLTMAGLEVTSLEEKSGDYVFEIEITSNRPDWLSVIGIAREAAAITGKRLKWSPGHQVILRQAQDTSSKDTELSRSAGSQVKSKKTLQLTTYSLQPVSLKIEDKRDCPLYTAGIISDVKAGPSPDWLKKRLELVGIHSVNNIVDITNYVLFESGHPLHAFDLDKVLSQASAPSPGQLEIVTRRAKKDEELTTIDGIKRKLDGNILVIAAAARGLTSRPIAIAGVIGGKDTEITAQTKNVLLESAVFSPVVVRRSRQNLGVQSDSSYRFERGTTPEMCGAASERATRLINEVSGGTAACSSGHKGAQKTKRKDVELKLSAVKQVLGIDIAASRLKGILSNLGFKIKPKAGRGFSVEVPFYRQDVNLESDLIEEIARIFGYEAIPSTLPRVVPQVGAGSTRETVSLIKNILIGCGLNEVITYSLVDRALLELFDKAKGASAVEISNPLSKEQGLLRPALYPSVAACIAHNLRQKQERIEIFEVASTFSPASCGLREEPGLCIGLCGTRPLLLEQGLVRDRLGLLHLKGIIEVLFSRLGIKDYGFRQEGQRDAAILVKDEKIGFILRLPEPVQEELGIKNREAVLAELSLNKVFARLDLEKKFKSLPVYPGVLRDISLVVGEDVPAGDLLRAIKDCGISLLNEARLVDYYQGRQIPAGLKSLTISCLYRSDERTLTEAEINPLHAQVAAALTEKFKARTR